MLAAAAFNFKKWMRMVQDFLWAIFMLIFLDQKEQKMLYC
jgi:hypothetical protein